MALTLLLPAQIPWVVIGGPAEPCDEINPADLVLFMPVQEHPGADLELARERIELANIQGDGTAEHPFWLNLNAFPGVSPFGAILRIWELLRPDHGLETIFFAGSHYFEVGALGVAHIESGWTTQLAEDVPVPDAERSRTFTGALEAAGGDDRGVVPIAGHPRRHHRAR